MKNKKGSILPTYPQLLRGFLDLDLDAFFPLVYMKKRQLNR